MSARASKVRAQIAYLQRRRESGDVRKEVWLSKDAAQALDRLSAVHGSDTTAIQVAILTLDLLQKAKTPTS